CVHRAVMRIAWTVRFAGVGAAVTVFRFLRPWCLSLRHRLAVGSIVHEAPDIITIRITGRNVHRLRARPGQYFRWRFLAPGAWYLVHPFSLSEEPGGRGLRITVRPAGRHTAMPAPLPGSTPVLPQGPRGGPGPGGRRAATPPPPAARRG